MEGKKTSLGLSENIEAVLAYALTFLSGFAFLIIEKDNKFVRFHAMQSFITFIMLIMLSWIIGIVPILGSLVSWIISRATIILWIVLMYNAFRGKYFKVPVIGEIVEKQLNK